MVISWIPRREGIVPYELPPLLYLILEEKKSAESCCTESIPRTQGTSCQGPGSKSRRIRSRNTENSTRKWTVETTRLETRVGESYPQRLQFHFHIPGT